MSLKMSAACDILISLYNPNRREEDLSHGAGQLHHDGEYIGSFMITPWQITLQVISDIVVVVMLTNLWLHAWSILR